MKEVVFAGKRRFMFEYAGETEVQTKTGAYRRLALWEAECTTCGHYFYITGPLGCDDVTKNSNFGLRNCPEHRNPRRSAIGLKGHAARVAKIET
jgi:hypothetical protein